MTRLLALLLLGLTLAGCGSAADPGFPSLEEAIARTEENPHVTPERVHVRRTAVVHGEKLALATFNDGRFDMVRLYTYEEKGGRFTLIYGSGNNYDHEDPRVYVTSAGDTVMHGLVLRPAVAVVECVYADGVAVPDVPINQAFLIFRDDKPEVKCVDLRVYEADGTLLESRPLRW